MKDEFGVEIIGPEKIIFSDKATTVTLPAYEGNMGVMSNHIPIITFLRPGIIKILKKDGNFLEFFVQDGITEYFNQSLAVLSTSVVNVKDASKDFLNDLNKKTLDELSLKSITDHERYLLNHKLDTLKEMGV